jgi:heat shock protein HslJ
MRLSFFLLALVAVSCQTRPPQETAAARPPARVVPNAQLRETRWVPRQLAGQLVAAPADTQEPYLLLRANGTAEGNGSCNRFRGTFSSEKSGELKFSPLMSTRMACAALAIENEFTKALGQSSTYRISGDTLVLFNATSAPVARLEAVYLR